MSRRYHYSAPMADAGFTLIELLISMSLAIFMTILILGFSLDYWGSISTLANDSATFVERENAGDELRNILNAGSHLINQNSIADNYPLVAADSTHWELIHAVPDTVSMPTAGNYTPLFYFNAPSVDASKNFIMNGAQPYYDEFVLYLSGSNNQLVLRTLVNPGAISDTLKTSCPPANASASCPADTVISGGLSSIDLAYYSRSGNLINYESSTDPNTGLYNGPDFSAAEVIQLTLHYSRRSIINGAAASLNQSVVRVALRN